MGTALMSVTIDCLHTATHLFPKFFHDGSATFTTGDFECMVCLKKFTLQKSTLISQQNIKFVIDFSYVLKM